MDLPGLTLLKTSIHHWRKDRASMMAAATSYYLLVTLAPLVLVLLWVGTALLGAMDLTTVEAIAPAIPVSSDAAETLEGVIEGYSAILGGYNTVVALGVALAGATAFLVQFIRALDVIFGMGDAEPQGWWRYVRRHLLSIAALAVVTVIAAGTSLAYSLLRVAISSTQDLLGPDFTTPTFAEQVFDLGPWLGFLALTLLFSLAFAYLPARCIRYADVLPGAVFTTGLFTLGQTLLGRYIENSSIITAWGAASTFVAIVIWVYYTMQVILFGAEFTRVWVDHAEEARGVSTPCDDYPSRGEASRT